MNWAALLDSVLALSALGLAWRHGGRWPGLGLGAVLLGIAAVLGSLRFSGLMPLPSLHQFASLIGAAVGLPLIATTVAHAQGGVANTRRYTWIMAVILAVLAVVVTVVGGIKLWPTLTAVVSVVAVAWAAARQRSAVLWGVAIALGLGFAAFASRFSLGPWGPGEFLHIGLSAGLWGLVPWLKCHDLKHRS
jgi:lysylphosphatidylglycerol synthetase-like protein (DUF2156 family)